MMNHYSLLLLLFFATITGFSQNNPDEKPRGNKGKIYFYWGWNRAWYTNSDITLTGTNYDFTLEEVVAKDRQSPLDVKVYLNPLKMTIPQYNFRIGYFINDKYNISFGNDHMKYVMVQNQVVKISGEINDTETSYPGKYSNEDITLKDDFLRFEHTDGLNYENLELRRLDELISFKNSKVGLTEGIGIGILYPRTNTTLLEKERYDEFHLAGYGVDAIVGVTIEFYQRFFILAECKGGYINMPDIRTTKSKTDKASQSFFFSQVNIVFGMNFHLRK